MNDLFHGFEFICSYIDDLLILTKVDWTDHVKKLELILNKLKRGLFRFNIEKSFFGHNKMEYLGLWVTRYDVKPINKKIEAITNTKPPTS